MAVIVFGISCNLVHEGGTNSESFFRLRIVLSVIVFMNIYIYIYIYIYIFVVTLANHLKMVAVDFHRLIKCEYEVNFIQISGTLLAVKEKHFRT